MADKFNPNSLDAFTKAPRQSVPATGDVLLVQRGNTTQYLLFEDLKSQVLGDTASTDGSIQELVEGTTDGTSTTFSFVSTTPASADNVFAFVDGRLDRSVTVDGKNVTFDTPPPAGERYTLIHWQTVGGGSGGGVTDHGTLTGLSDDDHTQYLLADGSRAATGNLDLGNNSITNVAQVDGRTIGSDGTKLDGIAEGAQVNPAQVSASEISAGTETGMRSYSPADVLASVQAYAPGGGDMLASTYDPNTVQDDAFDMDNMAEGTNTKVMTDAERTKLSGIEDNATADQTGNEMVTAINGALGQTAWQLASITATGTPVAGQIGVWTSASVQAGYNNFQWNNAGNQLQIIGGDANDDFAVRIDAAAASGEFLLMRNADSPTPHDVFEFRQNADGSGSFDIFDGGASSNASHVLNSGVGDPYAVIGGYSADRVGSAVLTALGDIAFGSSCQYDSSNTHLVTDHQVADETLAVQTANITGADPACNFNGKSILKLTATGNITGSLALPSNVKQISSSTIADTTYDVYRTLRIVNSGTLTFASTFWDNFTNQSGILPELPSTTNGFTDYVLRGEWNGSTWTWYLLGESTRAVRESLIIAVGDQTSAATTGAAKETFRMPYAFRVTEVRGSLTTAATGAAFQMDINEGGTSILSTKLTIDASEKTSTTAVIAPVISDSDLADDAEITIDIDTIGSTVAGTGPKVTLIGYKI